MRICNYTLLLKAFKAELVICSCVWFERSFVGEIEFAAGTTATAPLAGPGGLGVQLPSTFRDPASSVGAPGPSGTYWVAGGGGGASDGPAPTAGGGGGAASAGVPQYAGAGYGAYYPNPGTRAGSASANTGSGGGGSGSPASTLPGSSGNGGSGLVLIAYDT